MPTLSSKSLILPAGSFQGLNLLSENLSKAMELYIQPIIQAQEVMENLFEPIRQMQEDLKNAFLPIQQMCESFSKTLQPTIEMMNIAAKIFENYRPTNFVEGEILESEKVQSSTLLTQAVTVTTQRVLNPTANIELIQSVKSKMGLREIIPGSFQYKRKTLKKLSYRNNEGKLLSLFLKDSNLFVKDEDIYATLGIPENRNFSWILRDLKDKFKENNLLAMIERRWNPDGYIFISVEYLQ